MVRLYLLIPRALEMYRIQPPNADPASDDPRDAGRLVMRWHWYAESVDEVAAAKVFPRNRTRMTSDPLGSSTNEPAFRR